MEFSNLYFLYFFLPIMMAVYFLMPGIRAKNIALLAGSLLFYAMGQPLYLLLLVATAVANYFLGKRIVPGQKSTLLLPLIINLVPLVFFKYTNFLLGMFGITGAEGAGVLSLTLPIGISFYTFQMVSYIADIYMGKSRGADSFMGLLLYISMFPKIVMGPIVRYESIAAQLTDRRVSPRGVFEGAVRFVVGLAKKVLVADYAFTAYTELTKVEAGAAAWLAALLFMFYIYFEFSGCSDMAIALGRIFGFRYSENFDLPYASESVTVFWRRWHMTLGSWFRDYVYIPLGGNRCGKGRQILNMLAVWGLTGLWHGANWNYIIWGLYFFLLLVAEKSLMPKLQKVPYLVRNLVTMFFVLVGWVIFSNESLPELGKALASMFGAGPFWTARVGVLLKNSLLLILLCFLGASKLPRILARIWENLLCRGARRNEMTIGRMAWATSELIFVAVLLYLCTASLVGAASVPSLYASF